MRIYWLIAAILGLLVFLHWQFPAAVTTFDEKMRILYLVLFVLLIGSGSLMSRASLPQNLRNAAIWGMIIASLMLVYYGLRTLKG